MGELIFRLVVKSQS